MVKPTPALLTHYTDLRDKYISVMYKNPEDRSEDYPVEYNNVQLMVAYWVICKYYDQNDRSGRFIRRWIVKCQGL